MQQNQEELTRIPRASAYAAEWIKHRVIASPGSTLFCGRVSGWENNFPPASSTLHIKRKAATQIMTLHIQVLGCLKTGCCKCSSADCFQAFRTIL